MSFVVLTFSCSVVLLELDFSSDVHFFVMHRIVVVLPTFSCPKTNNLILEKN